VTAARIEVVVFDLGGVVCRFEPDARLIALARATGLEVARIKAAVWDSGLDAALDRGELDLVEAVAAVSSALENRIGEDELLTAWAKAFVVDPEVVALASSLDRRSAILTNNGSLLEACFARGLVRVDRVFHPVLFAGQLGATKPDPVAYRRAAVALGEDPARLLLVDDAPANIAGAKDAGWQAIHFASAARLREDLVAAGISS
jgi:putative hydrolase of the HAD superfamily